jgi:hypothetical protein
MCSHSSSTPTSSVRFTDYPKRNHSYSIGVTKHPSSCRHAARVSTGVPITAHAPYQLSALSCRACLRPFPIRFKEPVRPLTQQPLSPAPDSAALPQRAERTCNLPHRRKRCQALCALWLTSSMWLWLSATGKRTPRREPEYSPVPEMVSTAFFGFG